MPKKVKILVVDDDVNTCTTLSDLLSEGGYKVIVATDGEGALDKVYKEKPHVVLMDIRLPGLDGYEVCQKIKEIEGLATKVILYTAYINAVNVAKARAVGADDFLGKTSGFSNMRNAIEGVFLVRHAEQ